MSKYSPFSEDQWARRRCAYELTKPAMLAIPAANLVPVDVDIPSTAQLVRSKVPKIHAMRSQVASSLADFDMRTIDRLDLYVQAMGYAHWVHQSTFVSVDRLQEWLDEWPTIQRRLLGEANRLVADGRVQHCRVELCPVRADGRDEFARTKRLFCLLYLNLARTEKETDLRAHEIVHAEVVTELAAIAAERNGDLFEAKRAIAENRQRAFTLFLKSYDQARRAIQFVRWNIGDADDIAPALVRQARRHRLDSSPPASNKFLVRPIASPTWYELPLLRRA